MDLGFTLGKDTAVVVGGARGIGRAIATRFAEEGAGVILWDIAPDALSVAAGLTARTDVRTQGMFCDITNESSVASQAAVVAGSTTGRLHLVLAAAIGSGRFGFPFWNLAPGDWARVMTVNIQGIVNCLHAFAPILIQRPQSTVTFLASIAGQIGSQTDPPYSASKAAVINFAQCAAKDFAPYDVRVNTLCPGMVQTPLNQSVYQAWADQQPPDSPIPDYDAWANAKIARHIPLNRWQTPDDIANLAVFLASVRANNITGQTMNVDGGFVMHW